MNIKKYFLPLILPIIVLIFIIYLSYTPPNATAAESGRWEKPQLLSESTSTTNKIELRPKFAVDKKDNAIAVWLQPNGKQNNLWVAHYVKEKGWGKAEIIEKNIGGASNVIDTLRSINSIRLIIDSKGGALVVWIQPTGAKKASIWAKQYDVNKGWKPAEPIEINIKGITAMDVASDEKGNAILSWSQSTDNEDSKKSEDNQSGQVGNDIWAKKYTTDKGWDTAEPIETNLQKLSGFQSDFQIVMDTSGNAMLVFNQEYKGIYAKRYEPSKGWKESQIISKQPFFTTRITVAPNNDIFFIGHQHDNSKGIIGATRYKVGKDWEPLQIIHEYYESSNDQAIDVAITVDINSNALAVWSWSDYYGRGINYKIWGSAYDEGKGWNTPKVISTGKGGRVYLNIINISNTTIVMWSLKKDGGVSSSLLATIYEVVKRWGKPQIIDTDIKRFAFENGIAVYTKTNGVWATRFVKEK